MVPARPAASEPPRAPRFRAAATGADFAPIATINTTPLVDVMLVLLVMFIMIIPVTSHKVPLDLPINAPTPRAPPPVHRLGIAANGALAWDGRGIAPAALRARLAALAADPADPILHLDADGAARYEQVDQLLADIRRAGVTRLGFVGNDRFVGVLDR